MKAKNFVLGTILTIGGVILITQIVKNIKKTHAVLEKREEENKKVFSNPLKSEEVTDDEELEEKEINEEDTVETGDSVLNLPKELFEIARFEGGKAIPMESVDTVNIHKIGSQKVVHIRQTFDYKLNRNVLHFMFEIPDSVLTRKSDVNIGSFISDIRGKWNEREEKLETEGTLSKIMEDLIKSPKGSGIKINGPKPVLDTRMEGYMYVRWIEIDEDDKEFEETRLVMITRDLYKNNVMDPTHDRVTEYVSDINEKLDNDEVEYIDIVDEYGDTHHAEVVEAFVVMEVTVLAQDRFNLDGIDKYSGLEILDYIYNEFSILTKKGNDEFTYDYFLFYNPDRDASVYSTEKNEDGKYNVVSISSVEYIE